MTPLELSKSSRRAFERLAGDLTKIFGSRLASLAAFGQSASVAFTTSLDTADLEACAALVESWRRDGLAPPLVMTVDEFTRSLDTFPLEYSSMNDSHVVILGEDLFATATVNPDDLRRACEVQARGLLIHLRQGWLDAGGHEDDLDEMVAASAVPLRHLLSHVARLEGAPAASLADLTRFASERLGLPGDLVGAILALDAEPDSAHQVAQRLPDYIAAAERLWAFVDTWRAR
jgi:hypothetical protein